MPTASPKPAPRDLIADLGLVIPPGDPEPDPRDKQTSWVSWFRRHTHCDLRLAADGLVRRRKEWEAMEDATR